jgi:hypothetical protein
MFEVLSLYFPGVSEGKLKTLRIAGVPAVIRTEYLPNTVPERYRCVNLLGQRLL